MAKNTNKKSSSKTKSNRNRVITKPGLLQELENVLTNATITPSTIKFNGVNSPLKIGLSLLANNLGFNSNSIEDIIFNKSNSYTIVNKNNIENNIIYQPCHYSISYAINPVPENLTSHDLQIINYIEISNNANWTDLLKVVIDTTYHASAYQIEYSAIIGTLNTEDESIFISAEELLKMLINRGFITPLM